MSEQPLISGRGTCWKDKRSPNTYRYYFSLGIKDPKTGRYKRSPTYTVHCKTKTEAKAAMQAKLAEINSSGTVSKTKKPTLLASYCWAFHENRDTELAPTSYEREAYDCRHIEDLFGAFQTIEGLTPDLIEETYAEARRTGKYKPSELVRINAKLRQILSNAVAKRIIDRNPCATVHVRRPRNKRESLTIDQVATLCTHLQHIEVTAEAVGTLVLVYTGMRKGEMLGLEWRDWDPANKTLKIDRQYTNDHELRAPKSQESQRKIPVGETLAERLQSWSAIQKELLASLGLSQTGRTPIISDIAVEQGVPTVCHMKNYIFNHWFRDFAVSCNLGIYEPNNSTGGKLYKGICPHQLRHCVSTFMLANGSDVRSVQGILGHADPNITLKTYTSLVQQSEIKAVKGYEDFINAYIQRSEK